MTVPADEFFKDQWHLQNTVVGQYDLDVVKAWDDYTGKGVRVVVMDSGVDYTHSDIAPNYDTTADHDYGQGDDDPSPANTTANESHGTAVAGIIGAARNGSGVVGVAYDATLIGYRIEFTDLQLNKDAWAAKYAAALNDVVSNDLDVVNMSFGFTEYYGSYLTDAQRLTQWTALENAADNGRDGLGAILVHSAGNDRAVGFNINFAEVGNDTKQIDVAALDRYGAVTSYSSFGAALLVSALGSPIPGQVVTTDRTGANGYSGTDYTTSFNGTSAAAPMVSGIAALMLEANPDLGWRDVQTILAISARHVGSPIDGTIAGNEHFAWYFNGAGNWNGGGLHFSEDYGYGLVDGLAAVRLAETWNATPATTANQKWLTMNVLSGDVTVPDADLTGKSYSATAAGTLTVERVTVSAHLDLGRTGDLEVYITGPDGKERQLTADAGDYYSDYIGASTSFTFHSQTFRGMSSAGTWSVRVVDDQAGEATIVSDLKIGLYGAASSKNDTYFYTNEFSDYAGKNGHSKTLTDTDGGLDTLNASAVTAAMTVDLSKGTGRIDGVTMKIRSIENVFGGDGNDHLTGSNLANKLSGGRGLDILTGGKGADTFIYHLVKDSLAGKKHDVIGDFAKGDHIDLGDIDTMARAGDQAFRFIGTKDFTGAAAQLDFDLIDRRGTAHDLTMVYADLDGDKRADFQIELAGLHTLLKGDFIL